MVRWWTQFAARVHLTFAEHGEGRLRSFTFGESWERRVPMSMDGVEGLRWIRRFGRWQGLSGCGLGGRGGSEGSDE